MREKVRNEGRTDGGGECVKVKRRRKRRRNKERIREEEERK